MPFSVGIILLPPATKLGQGYVFTGVCDSVHRGGLPQCMLGYHPTPLKSRCPPRGRHPPGVDTPQEQTPLGADTYQEQTPPGSRHPPEADTPQEQTPPRVDIPQPPPGADNPHPREQTPPRSRPPGSSLGLCPRGSSPLIITSPSCFIHYIHSDHVISLSTLVQFNPNNLAHILVRLFKQECIPLGCVPSKAVAVYPRGSVSVHAGIPTSPPPPWDHAPLPPGPCTPWDQTLRTMHPPRADLPPCGQTDTCKNITFATSLRTVTMDIGCLFIMFIQNKKTCHDYHHFEIY